MEILVATPIAFLIYILLVSLLLGIGRVLAGSAHPSLAKSSPYASGEKSSRVASVPGYRPFFRVALFFAILHLGALVLATGGFTEMAGIYLLGLMFALIALILG